MAPVFTPFHENFTIRYDLIPEYSKYLKDSGINGILVNGTSGEGVSMTVDERKKTAECWANECKKNDQTLMVQVGGTCLKNVQALAAHAENDIKASAILCLPDLFFKPNTIEELVDYLTLVSQAAPQTPLFYYHIPMFTRVNLDMAEFLKIAYDRIPTLSGLKFTFTDLEMGWRCLQFDSLTIFLGAEQLTLSAWVLGFDSAISTTLNCLPESSLNIIEKIKMGDVQAAKIVQDELNNRIRHITNFGSWVTSMKAFTSQISGINMGSTRPPLKTLTENEIQEMMKLFIMNKLCTAM